MTPAEEEAFKLARSRTGRDAFTLFKKAENVDGHDAAAVMAAGERFRALPLLLDPVLRDGSISALRECRGSRRTGAERFPATIWTHGAEHTHGGRPFLGTLRDFAERLLPDRARAIAPKRTGWVLEPTTNPEGRRTNEETHAVHALFLDCDGAGDWQALLSVLRDLEFCHVAYQSGGWSPASPKWRIVLPLETPHATTTETGRELWRAIYGHARVVFGAAGQLMSTGFDASTDTPCCPWFLTEKRSPSDPERRIEWHPGHALDLTALALALPPIETIDNDHEERGPVETISLTPEQTEEIIDALAAATVQVPSGRRDIYLAMPAVMLNRGVHPDDVLGIVEEVSSRYPRQHADKHADNLHCAETTINKWLAEGSAARITQIGTLQALAPEVAAALDQVLPDPLTKALADSFETAVTTTPTPPSTVLVDQAPAAPVAPPKSRRRKLSKIGRLLAPIAARLRKHKNPDRQVQGYLIERILRGESLRPDGVSVDKADDLVNRAIEAIGFHVNEKVTWQAVLDEAGPTLLVMNFAQSSERIAAAEAAFNKGQLSRKRSNYKRELKKINEQEERAHQGRKCVS